MGTQDRRGTYLELLEFGEHVRAQCVHARLGVPGELDALTLIRGGSGLSIPVVSDESGIDRSGVFRGALTDNRVFGGGIG
jgi:hypothetical protein